MKRIGLAIALASLLFGCGMADPEATGQRSSALYYATPSGPEDDAVLKLRALKNDGSMLWCTATLIAPNLVLTAMHCVAMVSGNADCTAEGELPAGSIDGVFGATFTPSNITFHVGAGTDEPVAALGEKIFTTGAANFCKDDLAIVALDRELSDVPLAAIRLGAGNQRNEAIRIVGFGGTEDGSTGARKTRDDLTIQLVGKSEYSNSNDPIPPNTFATIGVSVCNGDSGGPVFTTKNAVTGVVSHGSTCASTTAHRIFTQIAPYEDVLLRPAFEYAGHEPIAEASDPSDAGGQTGEAGSVGEGVDGGNTSDASAGTGGAMTGASGYGGSPLRSPPGKGGCACSSTATSGPGDIPSALAIAVAFGAAFGLRRRARR